MIKHTLFRRLPALISLIAILEAGFAFAAPTTAPAVPAQADTVGLPEEVRSHASVKAYTLLRDRAQDDEANKMLDQAIRLNALNIDALWMHYDRAVDTGGPYERVSALLALARANPANPDVL